MAKSRGLIVAAAALAALGACRGCAGTRNGAVAVPPREGDAAGNLNVLPQPAELKPNPGRTIYYVRPGGGSSSQCTGLANADYPGSGAGRACALSHPFYALQPGSQQALLVGGDTLVIGRGSYKLGHGAPNGGSVCSASNTWDCHLPPIPSGTAAAPTRILGEGWNTGCTAPPELYGVERAYQVLDLRGSSNVQLECLEITDHSQCVESHSGGIACNRDSYPYGDWAAVGLQAADSQNVLLRNLNIHGLAHTGIHAGRLTDWTLEHVRIAANGWAGWDGDLTEGDSGNRGKLVFREVTIELNGCGETYPGGKPVGCWGQSAGGYGDGLGTAATGGDWVFEDCRFLHNTSDGLDLLYHSRGGSITIRRTRAEGNAGNPIKVTGDALIVNSIMVSNCAYFKGKAFTHDVDHCRALGNALELSYVAGSSVQLINSTLHGVGDVLISAHPREGHRCNGTEKLTALNNIFLGGTDYHQPFEKTALAYLEGCTGLRLDSDYAVVHGVKGRCKVGPHDLCRDPRLGPLSGDVYGMVPQEGSPAIDSGKAVGGVIPAVDFLRRKRPAGGGVDRGAYEIPK